MSGKKSLLIIALLSFVTVRLIGECSPNVVVQVPPSACKSGTATVAVIGVPGATYAWSVNGGTITSDATSDRINLTLGTNATATVLVTMTAGGCVSQGSGVIPLHDAFGVRVAAIPAAHASEPLTIFWAYENGSPSRQTISGTDFGTLALAPGERSFTYTPATSGSKQIVIDASMDAPSSTPVPSRQRAVAKSPASASSCAVAHSSAPYSVGECVAPTVVIDAPDSVVHGSTFQVSVRSQPGAVATWTIQNGTPANATGDSVTVIAGSTGSVDVSVSLARGSCVRQLDRSIAIAAIPVCNNPKATVSAGPVSCGSAIVNANFTGTPPFQGSWSDGALFNTTSTSLTRLVAVPGNYSIVSFEDAACAGTASGVAVLPSLGPSATITATGNGCVGVDTITATFTGKPPFSGRWTDNSSFETNDMQIVKPITTEGSNTLSYAYDSTECRMTIIGNVQALPAQKVQAGTFCLAPEFDNVIGIYANFVSYFTLPLTVAWDDGVTMTSSVGTPVYRFFKPDQTKTYTIVSAHDAYCTAAIEEPASVTVYASAIPDFALGIGEICVGATKTASLSTPPPPGAQVNWFVDNATIVSGQGTSSIQYKAGDIGSMMVGCTFNFSDAAAGRCPTSHRQFVRVDPDPTATLSLSSQQIHAGETVTLTFSTDGVFNWSFDNTLNDSIQQVGICSSPHATGCQALYTSSHGPGPGANHQVTITMHAIGTCTTKDYTTTLTILP